MQDLTPAVALILVFVMVAEPLGASTFQVRSAPQLETLNLKLETASFTVQAISPGRILYTLLTPTRSLQQAWKTLSDAARSTHGTAPVTGTARSADGPVVPSDEMKRQFAEAAHRGDSLVGFVRDAEDHIQPIFSKTPVFQSLREQPPSEFILALELDPRREMRIIPLKRQRIQPASFQTTDDWDYLPNDLQALFKGGEILVTDPSQKDSSYSVLMAVTPAGGPFPADGRTGVLLQDGLPVIVRAEGREFVLELKGVGSADGGYDYNRTIIRGGIPFDTLRGGLDEHAARDEFGYLEEDRPSEPAFHAGESPRAIAVVTFPGLRSPRGQPMTQGYLLRLAPSTVRATFRDNPAFDSVNPEDQLPQMARQMGEQIGRSLARGRIMASHPENLMVIDRSRRYPFTDYGQIIPLADFPLTFDYIHQEPPQALTLSLRSAAQIPGFAARGGFPFFLEGLADSLRNAEKITPEDRDRVLACRNFSSLSDLLWRTFVAADYDQARREVTGSDPTEQPNGKFGTEQINETLTHRDTYEDGIKYLDGLLKNESEGTLTRQEARDLEAFFAIVNKWFLARGYENHTRVRVQEGKKRLFWVEQEWIETVYAPRHEKEHFRTEQGAIDFAKKHGGATKEQEIRRAGALQIYQAQKAAGRRTVWAAVTVALAGSWGVTSYFQLTDISQITWMALATFVVWHFSLPLASAIADAVNIRTHRDFNLDQIKHRREGETHAVLTKEGPRGSDPTKQTDGEFGSEQKIVSLTLPDNYAKGTAALDALARKVYRAGMNWKKKLSAQERQRWIEYKTLESARDLPPIPEAERAIVNHATLTTAEQIWIETIYAPEMEIDYFRTLKSARAFIQKHHPMNRPQEELSSEQMEILQTGARIIYNAQRAAWRNTLTAAVVLGLTSGLGLSYFSGCSVFLSVELIALCTGGALVPGLFLARSKADSANVDAHRKFNKHQINLRGQGWLSAVLTESAFTDTPSSRLMDTINRQRQRLAEARVPLTNAFVPLTAKCARKIVESKFYVALDRDGEYTSGAKIIFYNGEFQTLINARFFNQLLDSEFLVALGHELGHALVEWGMPLSEAERQWKTFKRRVYQKIRKGETVDPSQLFAIRFPDQTGTKLKQIIGDLHLIEERAADAVASAIAELFDIPFDAAFAQVIRKVEPTILNPSYLGQWIGMQFHPELSTRVNETDAPLTVYTGPTDATSAEERLIRLVGDFEERLLSLLGDDPAAARDLSTDPLRSDVPPAVHSLAEPNHPLASAT